MRRETLPRESLANFLAFVERLQPKSGRSADVDLANDTGPLKMKKRRKDQIIGDHPSTHDRDIETHTLRSHLNTPLHDGQSRIERWERILSFERRPVKLLDHDTSTEWNLAK